MLLEHQYIDVNECNAVGNSPLMNCARRAKDKVSQCGDIIGDGFIDIIKLILDHGKCNINLINIWNQSAFDLICFNAEPSLLATRMLLKHPTLNVNRHGLIKGDSSLMICARKAKDTINNHGEMIGNKHVAIMNLILDSGKCDINLTNSKEATALNVLCDSDKPSLLAVRKMLEQRDINVNKRDERGCSPLMNCARKANDMVDKHGDRMGNNHVGILRLILDHCKCDSHFTKNECAQAFNVLCDNFNPSVLAARMLIEHTVNANDVIVTADSPLTNCARKARDEVDEYGNRIGNDHVDIMRFILDQDIYDINSKNNEGKTVLNSICGIDKPSVKAVMTLLDHPNIDVNVPDKFGNSPLLLCALRARDKVNTNNERVGNDHVDIMRLILDHSECDVNLKNNQGRTALNLMFDSDEPSLLASRMLLKHPDISVIDVSLMNVARHAKDKVNELGDRIGNGYVDIMRSILDINFKNKIEETALNVLCDSEQPSLLAVRMLLKQSTISMNECDQWGNTALMNCARKALDKVNEDHERIGNDHFDIMKLILDHGKCDLNLKNRREETALNILCSSDDPSVFAAMMLLKYSTVNTNECDEYGNSPLLSSARRASDRRNKQGDKIGNSHVQIMRLILNHGKCDINLKNKVGATALNVICESDEPSLLAAKILLAQQDISINEHDVYDNSPLTNCARSAKDIVNKHGEQIGNDHVDIMRLLLDHNGCNKTVWHTALYWLGVKAEPSLIVGKMLLQKLDIKIVECESFINIASLILNHSECDVNLNILTDKTALNIICSSDEPSLLVAKMLLDHPDINVNEKDIDGNSPLINCAHKANDTVAEHGDSVGNDYVDIMRLILDNNKCELNLKNLNEQTALNVICNSDGPSVLAANMLLQRRGINVNTRDKKGFAPLMNCAKGAEVKLDENGIPMENSKTLILANILKMTQHDVDISLQNNAGFTVLHILLQTANTKNTKDTIESLTEIMKHPDISKCILQLDNEGRSVLDIFLTNDVFNAYDINITKSGKQILELLLRVKGLVTESKLTLSLAATVASPWVFKKLIENHACITNSLPDNESTAHCVIQRKSFAKSKIFFPKRPNLTIKWNHSTPLELAKSNRCKNDVFHEIEKIIDATDHQISEPHTYNDDANLSWHEVKRQISCTIRLNKENESQLIDSKIVFSTVRDNQQFFHKDEEVEAIKEIREAVDVFFLGFSEKLKSSEDKSHMAFYISLCGSMADRTKCYLPNEMDMLCIFRTKELTTEIDSQNRTTIEFRSRKFDVRLSAQRFYKEFARYCHEYKHSSEKKTLGIRSIRFEFMSKISRLEFVWGEGIFRGMKTKVDIVPIVHVPGYKVKNEIPLGAICDNYQAIFKANRHDYLPKTFFPISFAEAESQIMTSLPEPIRQGFIAAKAVRLTSICAPGIDLENLQVVEDLNIEDYLTSHILKNCLLLLLQNIFHNCPDTSKVKTDENAFDIFKKGQCKYKIADAIYNVFQTELESNEKRLRIWHGNPAHSTSLLSCEFCVGVDNICCRKRNIRLALIEIIRHWLTNRDHLKELHEGNTCSCSYSEEETHYYNTVLDHLNTTGKLLGLRKYQEQNKPI